MAQGFLVFLLSFSRALKLLTVLCSIVLSTTWALYFSLVKRERPIQVGINPFPTTILTMPGSVIASAFVSRTDRYR
jgi:hypothetical protein